MSGGATYTGEWPIAEKFRFGGVWFYIDWCFGAGEYYSLWCITDGRCLCTRGHMSTIDRKIRERAARGKGGDTCTRSTTTTTTSGQAR